MSRRSFGLLAASVAIALLLALPSAPLPLAGAARGGVDAMARLVHQESLVASLAPYPLDSSWADRAGFNGSALVSATSVTPRAGDVQVVLTLWPSQASFFDPVSAAVERSGPGGIAAAYGASPSDYAALEGYFVSHGLVVEQSWPDRLALTLDGSATDVGAAFGTTLLTGTADGRTVDFPSSVPSLPQPYQAEIAAVSGLSRAPNALELPFASLPTTSPTPSQGGGSSITPNVIHDIYNLNGLYNYSGSPHWATSIGIAILLWGYGYAPSDISTFLSADYPSRFPSPTIDSYPVDGAPAPSEGAVNDPSNASREMTLDIEWSLSEAPGATIDAVYAPDGSPSNGYSPDDGPMEDAATTAIGLSGVRVLSMSFGSADGGDLSFQSAMTMRFAEAANEGITVLAASGDTGGDARANCQGGPQPQFPAASPDVLAVGGTAPVISQGAFGMGTSLSSEPDWPLSGGGFSTTYPAPGWQKVGAAASAIAASNGGRAMPDVAGPSANDQFYFNGGPATGEGTSFSTPMWAGLIAEMEAIAGRSFGFVTQRIYEIENQSAAGTSGIAPITDGSPSCVASPGPSWDAITGWGSPQDALTLYEHLAGTYVDLNLSVDPSAVGPGGSATVSVVVTNASSHQPISEIPVEITAAGSIAVVSLCSGTLAADAPTTDATGSASTSVGVPFCYLGGSVVINATVDARGFLGSAHVTLGVSLLGAAGQALTSDFPLNILVFVAITGAAAALGLWIGRIRRRRHPRSVSVARAVPPPPRSAARSAPVGAAAPLPAPGAADEPPDPADLPAAPPAASTLEQADGASSTPTEPDLGPGPSAAAGPAAEESTGSGAVDMTTDGSPPPEPPGE